jgi:hypothetical protein
MLKLCFELEICTFQKTIHVGNLVNQYDIAKLFASVYLRVADSKCNKGISVHRSFTFQPQYFLRYWLCSSFCYWSPISWLYSSFSHPFPQSEPPSVMSRQHHVPELQQDWPLIRWLTVISQNQEHLPLTVHITFYLVQLLRKLLTLDGKRNANELQP